VLVNVDENLARDGRRDARLAEPAGKSSSRTRPDPEDNLALVAQMVAHFGADSEVRARADALTQALRDELGVDARHGRTAQRVLYLIWREPWMTVGTRHLHRAHAGARCLAQPT